MLFRRLVGVAVLIGVLGGGFLRAGVSAEQQHERDALISDIIARGLSFWHVTGKAVDDQFSRVAYDQFLEFLDFGRQFLLQEDLDSLNRFQEQVDDQLAEGRTDLLDQAVTVLRTRMDLLEPRITEILAKPFDFNQNDEIGLDARKRPYCKDMKELESRWYRMLKYQTLVRTLGYLESDSLEVDEEDPEQPAPVHAYRKENATTGMTPLPPPAKLAELEQKARASVAKSWKRIFSRLRRRNHDELLSLYLNAVLRVFDPHTAYFSPEEMANFNIQMSGRLEGIGALLTEEDGFVKVVRVIPGGPAWRSREMEAGDQILKVAATGEDPVDLVGMSVGDAVQYIRGPQGTRLALTLRKADGRIVGVQMTRDVVEDKETYAKSALVRTQAGKTYGYIHLPGFYSDVEHKGGRTSAGDLRQQLERFKGKGVAGVLLDLRGNGGGILQEAVEIAGQFIPEGPVVQVRGRDGEVEVMKDADGGKVDYEGPLVVMVDGLSASASEILAGALQDYHRAVLVGGDHTFGKGSVQVMVDLDRFRTGKAASLPSLGGLKLTIRKFYRISGGSNQYRGLVPDIPLPDRYTAMEIGERFTPHALPWDQIARAEGSAVRRTPLEEVLPGLKEASAKRVAQAPYFQVYEQYLKDIDARRTQSRQSLNLEKVRQQQAGLRQSIQEMDRLARAREKRLTLTAADPLPKGPERLLKECRQMQDDWLAELRQDVFMQEGIQILDDLAGALHAAGSGS